MKIQLLIMIFVLATTYVSAASGAIWTTNSDCGDIIQNVNHYAIGETVYINGNNFDSSTSYDWDISGQPGGASCDPGTIVANGAYETDTNGEFCFAAYTVANDDCGEYKVGFDNKNDNYRVDISIEDPTVPEFVLTAGIITLMGLAIGVTVLRKKN